MEVWGLVRRAVGGGNTSVSRFEVVVRCGGWLRKPRWRFQCLREGQEWAVTSNRGLAAGDNSSRLAFSAREGWKRAETHFEGGKGRGGQWREKREWQIARDGKGDEGQR